MPAESVIERLRRRLAVVVPLPGNTDDPKQKWIPVLVSDAELLLRVAEAADRMTPGSDYWAWSDSMMADLHEAVRALRAGGSDV